MELWMPRAVVVITIGFWQILMKVCGGYNHVCLSFGGPRGKNLSFC